MLSEIKLVGEPQASLIIAIALAVGALALTVYALRRLRARQVASVEP